jgi:hypothetical protein
MNFSFSGINKFSKSAIILANYAAIQRQKNKPFPELHSTGLQK